MFPQLRRPTSGGLSVLMLCFFGVAAWVLLAGGAERPLSSVTPRLGVLKPSGYPQLVSIDPLPATDTPMDGEMCQWVPASANASLMASLAEQAMAAAPGAASAADAGAAADADRAPLRVIRDTYPTYSAAVVDPIRNEIVAQDENLFQIMVFDRSANTPAKANFTEPKRVIAGPNTTLEFECGLYVDPKTGDIYSLANDVGDRLAVFTREAKGDVAPNRVLNTPHGIYGIAVDEERQEMYLSVQGGFVVVYRKTAQGDEQPLRTLQGPRTHLGSPYGIAVDTKSNLMFVASHGNFGDRRAGPSGARYETSLITVYPQDVSGNTPPIRLIQGPKTQLNWPALMFLDEERGELYVANDGDDSVLVFRVTDEGDVPPRRVVKGPKTNLRNPSSVYVDAKNNELVVSNLGNHSITVFPRDANGNVAPLRTIRSSPLGMPALTIVNPGGVAYDKRRDELLTPNWVGHPQIAAFARTAKGIPKPKRAIGGQITQLTRGTHDIRYDAVHDEIWLAAPHADAILTFRGDADGAQPPLRVLQGSKTQISADRLDVDPVHNELFVPARDRILVFRREAYGDEAPIRVIRGPNTQLRNSSTLTVDPVHDLIIVGAYAKTTRDTKEEPDIKLLFFNRTDEGNVKPRGEILIPKIGPQRTSEQLFGQMQVYPPKGWVIVTIPGADRSWESGEFTPFIGIWSINDRGTVPPRWKLGGKKSTLLRPRGVVLEPESKELIVSDMRQNALLTYYFPELF